MPPSPTKITNYVAQGLSQLTSQFQRARPDPVVATSPLTIFGANVALWLRADLGVTPGGTFTWADQSGNGDANRNFTQSTANRQPTFISSDAAFNNQPTISFSNSGSHFKSLVSGTWSVTLSQPYAVFAIASVDQSVSGNQRLWSSSNGDLDNYFAVGAGGHYNANSVDSGVAPTTLAATFLGALYNGASSKTYVQAKTPTATGNNGATTLGNHGMAIGDYGPNLDLFYGLTGHVAELFVVTVAPTTQNITDTAGYFTSRYAITIGA